MESHQQVTIETIRRAADRAERVLAQLEALDPNQPTEKFAQLAGSLQSALLVQAFYAVDSTFQFCGTEQLLSLILPSIRQAAQQPSAQNLLTACQRMDYVFRQFAEELDQRQMETAAQAFRQLSRCDFTRMMEQMLKTRRILLDQLKGQSQDVSRHQLEQRMLAGLAKQLLEQAEGLEQQAKRRQTEKAAQKEAAKPAAPDKSSLFTGDMGEIKRRVQQALEALAQDPSVPKQTKINMILHGCSLTCAVVACQPLPFADIMVLTPIQLAMVTALNKVIGNPFEKSSLKEVLASLLAVVGWGTLAQHVILGLYKTAIPFLGGVTTLPLVYGATFALGSCAKVLMEAKQSDREISKRQLKQLFEQQKKEAQQAQKKLTVSDAASQIMDWLKGSGEYNQYKTDLLALQKQISDSFQDEVALQQDVGALIEKKKSSIAKRVEEKYPNLALSDYVLSLLAVMDSGDFIQAAEQALAQIHFAAEQGGSEEKILEIQTEIGLFLAAQEEKIELLCLELKEQYKQGSVLQYMSLNQGGDVLQDEGIRDAFHQMIQKARRYLYIVSPWVGGRPYRQLCALLRESAAQNPELEIKMLYGYEPGDEKLENSRKWVGQYRRQLGERLQTKETFTHAKLALCDDEAYLLGSMNLLSFGGDYSEGDVRNELALLSKDSVTLQKLKKYYFNW